MQGSVCFQNGMEWNGMDGGFNDSLDRLLRRTAITDTNTEESFQRTRLGRIRCVPIH